MTSYLDPMFIGLSMTSLVTLPFISRWVLQRITSLKTSQKEPPTNHENVTISEYEKILQTTLSALSIPPTHYAPPCAELTDQIFSRIQAVTPNQAQALALSHIGALAAISFYPSHSAHLHLLIGLYTAFYLVLDDTGDTLTDQIPLFELLISLFHEFDIVFSSFTANKLFSGILSSLAPLEVEFDRTTISTTTTSPTASISPLFPRYFRNMTGSPEAYVYFLLTNEIFTPSRPKSLLHTVPELWNLTDELNDLFSFYKESIVGLERDTYVYDKARADGVEVGRVLRDIGEEAVSRVRRIERILEGDEVLGDLMRSFVMGQVRFYFVAERYRLGRLGLNLAGEAVEKVDR
ncbi:uncharacterized protein KD926_009688 [Aspergillus affinis]|uniref:uncharacterized protein n=1 Tax=Aspergillus affinis TaxID=1070780 RepID=UPI0022FEA3F3|nr:uncharacterized protein KD926_009688 [Aspergillus affinis]KAI9045274.1 hypothetical protein KD926_009688 [Aspergillus affinis]